MKTIAETLAFHAGSQAVVCNYACSPVHFSVTGTLRWKPDEKQQARIENNNGVCMRIELAQVYAVEVFEKYVRLHLKS